jgi:glycosyltransferase involved in cell wall biosynthesis
MSRLTQHVVHSNFVILGVSLMRTRVLWLIKGPGAAKPLLDSMAGSAVFEYEVACQEPVAQWLASATLEPRIPIWRLDPASDQARVRWARRSWLLRRRLRQGTYDVVHVHSPALAVITRLLVQTLPRRIRPVLVSTEYLPWHSLSPFTRAAHAATCRLDDVRLAASSEIVRSMPSRFAPGVEILIHGIDLDAVRAQASARAAVREKLAVQDDDVVIGALVDLQAPRASCDLLRAAAAVLASSDAVRFVILGQGPLNAKARSLHEQLDLGDRVQFLGSCPDGGRVLAGCELFAWASAHESLPVTLMQALALGLPVCGTRVSASEYVCSSVEGLLVPPGQPEQLATAILTLAGDPVCRKMMGEAAMARSKRFAVHHTARRLEVIYHALAAGRRNRGEGL